MLVLLLLVADTAAVVGPGKNISITLSAALQSFWVVVVVVAIALLLYSLCEFVVCFRVDGMEQATQCLPLLVLLNSNKSKNCNFSALSLSAFAFLTVSLFFRVMHVKREGGHVRGDTIKGLDFGVGQPPSFSACTLPALTSII